MEDINRYIGELKTLEKGLNKTIKKVVIKANREIVDAIKSRLYGTGIDGAGNFLGYYDPSTIRRWKKTTSHVTLLNTGNWYTGIFVSTRGNIISIMSKDKKNSMLIEKYGENILTLNEQEQLLIIIEPIDKEIQKIVNSFADIKIEVTT